MKFIEDFYLDNKQLKARGWTKALTNNHLGKADVWRSVKHFRNFTGKPTWFLERVRTTEASSSFRQDFVASIRRRGINADALQAFLLVREEQNAEYKAWTKSLTPEQVRLDMVAQEAAEIFREAVKAGLKTPHQG